jgi:asparagine synthase (glutamine-hydrolysing)
VPRPLRRLALAAARCFPASNEKIGLDYKLQRFLEGLELEPDEAHCHWNGTFNAKQRAELTSVAGGGRIGDLYAGAPASPALSRAQWFDQSYYLIDDILNKCDRMSMAHSLEVRPPFLDCRIVDFAASLPGDLKMNRRGQKYVLRELMRGKLPPELLRRRKQGFDIPTHDWLRGALRPMLMDTLAPQALAEDGLLDPGAVQRLVRAHLERRANLGFHLWGLLILSLWMRKWRVRAASVPLSAGQVSPLAVTLTN